MRKFPHQPGARSEDTLMARWKEASLRNCWQSEDDWVVPETAHLVTARTHALPLGEAARILGHAHTLQPIGIAETIEGLKAFFTASGYSADATVQPRLTEGCVAASDTTHLLSCTEPLTGLPT